ncbi:MAG: hypothetical protein OFPI_02330 [Osedax symbiont Rs2]|nr:MAG: hypothetical protein OFPI_02330 [Osedax symbiont Rs2]
MQHQGSPHSTAECKIVSSVGWSAIFIYCEDRETWEALMQQPEEIRLFSSIYSALLFAKELGFSDISVEELVQDNNEHYIKES